MQTSRPDFVISGGINGVAIGSEDLRAFSIDFSAPYLADDGMQHYGVTFVLQIPPGASGTYVIQFDPSQTYLNDQNFNLIALNPLVPATIQIAPPVTCGDSTCGAGETKCSCPADCGAPPSTETACEDGNDDDCDSLTDCADSDCVLVCCLATGGPCITQIIGPSGDGAGNILDAPEDVVVDSAGNVFVAGFTSNNVFKITPGGTITELIDSTGDGAGHSLSMPWRLAVGPSGNVYVTGSESHNAFRITPSGTITEIISYASSLLLSPTRIAVDSAENVYISGGLDENPPGPSTPKIFKITPGGTVSVLCLGGCRPARVAVDSSDNLLTVCAPVFFGAPSHLLKVSPGGATTRYPLPGGFSLVSLDSADNVYGGSVAGFWRISPDGQIVDLGWPGGEDTAAFGPGNIYRTDPSGDRVIEITEPVFEPIIGSGDGMGHLLDSPMSLAVDSAGRLYVAGLVSDNVFRIEGLPFCGDSIRNIPSEECDGTATGSCSGACSEFCTCIICGDSTCGAGETMCSCPQDCGSPSSTETDCHNGVDDDCDSFTDCADSECVDVGVCIDTEGTCDLTITQIIGPSGDGAGNILDAPLDLALDSAGNVFVSGDASNNVFKITPGGTITEIIDSTGDGAGHALSSPRRLAVSPSGNVYVTGNASHNAFRITPSGTITEIISNTSSQLLSPSEIAVDSAENVYIQGVIYDPPALPEIKIFKITPGGTVVVIDFLVFCPIPSSIVVDSVDNLYVRCIGNNGVAKVTPAGIWTEILAPDPFSFAQLLGLFVDSADNVYILDQNDLWRLSPDGRFARLPGGGGGNVAVFGPGNIYKADPGTDRVIEATQPIFELIDGIEYALDQPEGLVVDSSGRVYVTGALSDNLFKIEGLPFCGNNSLHTASEHCDGSAMGYCPGASACSEFCTCVICGDGICGGETTCSCPADCGSPTSTETACANGADDDCDSFIDCADSDCVGVPVCAGDNCSTAPVTSVPVGPRGSPETVTILGDNSDASGTDCLPNLGDVGWWVPFEIAEAAEVTIDFCGTDPVNRPTWAIIYPSCRCEDFILSDSSDRTTCGDVNVTLTFLRVAPGTYYYPVFTIPGYKRCANTNLSCSTDLDCTGGFPCSDNLHPYQIHISAEQPLGSCCAYDESCTDDVESSDCVDGSWALETCADRTCIVNSGADDCGSASVINLPVGPRNEPTIVTVLGDNSAASGTDCLPNPGDVGWWEAFEITDPAEVIIDFCGTDPVMRPGWAFLHTDCMCVGSVPNDSSNRTTCGDVNLTLTFLNLAPDIYYYPVFTIPGDKRCGNTGAVCSVNEDCDPGFPCSDNLHPYEIHLSARAPLTPAPNDDCADAIDLTGATFPVTFDTESATDDGPEIVHTDFHSLGTPAYNDIWYTYTSPSTCPLTVSLCEEPWHFDSIVSVYAGATCPPGDELMSDDESCETCEIVSCSGGPGEVTIRAVATTEYTIRVSGFAPSQKGAGQINVYCETDADGDGVVVELDPDDVVSSGDFSDGTTFGVVTGTPDTFLVRDVYRPLLGVLLIVDGPDNATIQACGSAGEFSFTPAPFGPGRHVITCPPGGAVAGGSGPVGVKVGQGVANAAFEFPGNLSQAIEVSTGGNATIVELARGLEVTVSLDSLPGAVTVNGNVIFPPGSPVDTTIPAITDFNASSLSVAVGEEVDFEVVFDDNAGDTDVVTFDFGDGSTDVVVDPATSPTLRPHTYTVPGIYDVTATVTDLFDSQATAQLTVEVYANDPPPTISWDSDPLSLGRTTRTLIFSVDPPVAATGTSGTAAIQIISVDLEHPVPGYQPSANPLPKNFTTWDTNSNGTCTNGDHAGHHCEVAADCRLCGGSGSNANKPCTTDAECTVGGQSNFCPTSVCSGDARRPCSSNGNCTGFGTCNAPLTYACGGLAACTGEGAMSPGGVGGCGRWVGKPEIFLEAQLPAPQTLGDYLGARLQCTPYYHDWVTATATEPVVVFGAEILPNSRYSVVAYSSSCKGDEGGCGNVSAPVEMRTRRAGDAVSLYNPPNSAQQPDVTDIGQVVAKFKKLLGSPSNSAAIVQANVPDPNSDVGVSDIVQVVDMAKQFVYPFGGPCPCPSLAVCGATPCPGGAGTCTGSGAPGLGAEATCIKLCRGGTNAGEQCNNHLHCGGGGVCDKECVGGTNNAQGCSGNGDCGKVCVGGPTPGAPCADASTCGGGTCPVINCVVVTNNAFCRDKCGRCN